MAGRECRPVTDDERAEVRRLHGEGMSLRGIAKEISRSPGVIGRIAKAEGLSFDSRPTQAATRAKQQDNKARRAAIVAGLYEVAEADLDYLRRDSGYDLVEVSAGQAVEYWSERLPAQDRKALVGAVSTGAQAAMRLEQMDAGDSAAEDRSVLGDLMAKLRSAADRG